MYEEMMQEIAKRLQRKYSLMNEVYRTTRELGDSVSRDDRVSSQLSIQMRQEAMDDVDKCEREIQILIANLPIQIGETVKNWMKWEQKNLPSDISTEGRLIIEISRNIRTQIQKTVEMDRGINLRLAGDKSYYRSGE